MSLASNAAADHRVPNMVGQAAEAGARRAEKNDCPTIREVGRSTLRPSRHVIENKDVPEQCAYHRAVLADPNVTEHDIAVAGRHGIDCVACGRIVGSFLIKRANAAMQDNRDQSG